MALTEAERMPGLFAYMAVRNGPDRGLFSIPPEEIRAIQADRAIIGGMVRYRRGG